MQQIPVHPGTEAAKHLASNEASCVVVVQTLISQLIQSHEAVLRRKDRFQRSKARVHLPDRRFVVRHQRVGRKTWRPYRFRCQLLAGRVAREAGFAANCWQG
jgi:hypothetical protein